MNRVLIVGGGAAGMFAAAAAARNGCDVSLFEKNEKLGKKTVYYRKRKMQRNK